MLFTGICLCDIFKIFGKQGLYSELLYLGPLYLTCTVFIIALCKIQNTIKAIKFARIHRTMTCIHFFNLITYTIFGTASRILSFLKNKSFEHGDPEQTIKHLKFNYYFLVVNLITNAFSLYQDIFVLYLILIFTKEK